MERADDDRMMGPFPEQLSRGFVRAEQYNPVDFIES